MRQAQPDRVQVDTAGTDPHVVHVEDLCDRVVSAGVEHHLVDLDTLGVDELVTGSRGRGRDQTLEDEDAVVGQVFGGVLEASDLVVLREQIADRVEDQVDEAVPPSGADAGHVADGHLDVRAARLVAHAVDHVLGDLDAVHAHAGCGQRYGDTAGPNGELQRISPAGELGEEGDGLFLVAADGNGVVTLRLLVSETCRRVKTLHVPTVQSHCAAVLNGLHASTEPHR